MKPAPPQSKAAERARRRTAAAQRRVVGAALIAVVAGLGVMWVSRTSQTPVPIAADVPGLAAGDDVALPIPPSDADLLLVNGGPSARVRADALPQSAPVSVDLAVPVRLEGAEVFSTRIMSEGREMLTLDGHVGGPERNLVRIEIPEGWLEPGSYLIEIKTLERTHFPLRRFALMVD